MAKDIVADLHSHTTASDGELSPEQLVDSAADAGLEAFAITDHDAVDSVRRAVEHGKKRGIEIIPGCELTVYDGRIEMHVLALFVDDQAPAFVALLQNMQRCRRERALAMAAKLRDSGIAIDDSDILEAAGGAASIGRPHVAAALIKRGHARTVNAAMLHFLREGAPGYVEKFKLPAREAFAATHAAGGVAILAHPGIAPHDELIPPLFSLGMDGVEAIYPSHSPVNRRYYTGLARRYEKLISGGSDYHGPRVRPNIQVANAGLDRASFEALRRKAQSYLKK